MELFAIFLLTKGVINFGAEDRRAEVKFSPHHIKLHASKPDITGNINLDIIIYNNKLDCLAREMLARFIHCKVSFSSFPNSTLWK